MARRYRSENGLPRLGADGTSPSARHETLGTRGSPSSASYPCRCSRRVSYAQERGSSLERFLIVFVTLFTINTFTSLHSEGCRNPCTIPTLERAFAQASSVFYGTVTENVESSFTNQLTFQVLRIWKGESASVIVVTAQGDTCDPLGDNTKVGDKVLIFAIQEKARDGVEDAKLKTGYCSGSVKFEWKVKEERYFPKLNELSREK
jgi:hypothetical protein